MGKKQHDFMLTQLVKVKGRQKRKQAKVNIIQYFLNLIF